MTGAGRRLRDIYLARMEKPRPVLVLTREAARPHRPWVTVAPITSTVRRRGFEVAVGRANGLDHEGVVNCDAIHTLRVSDLGRHVGHLLEDQEPALSAALRFAFDLRG